MIRPSPGDCRRAAALIVHHLMRDTAGVSEILTEAREGTRRPTMLLLALLETYESIMTMYLTPVGLHAFGEAVEATAANDIEPEVARGAEAILGRRLLQPDRIAAAMREADAAGQAESLFLAILGIHDHLAPFLRTPTAIEVLRDSALMDAANEHPTDKEQ